MLEQHRQRRQGLPNLNTGPLDTSGSPTFNVVDNSISPFGTQGCNCPLQESEQVFQIVNNWTNLSAITRLSSAGISATH